MGDYLYIKQLRSQIDCVETELQQAFDTRKPFYEIKEIVQRMRLLLNELALLRESEVASEKNSE